MNHFDSSQQFAEDLDQADPLREFRDEFCVPQQDGLEVIYFAGNSLGLQPRAVSTYVNEELVKWQTLGVEGHFAGQYPWLPYHEFLTPTMARLVGGLPEEVVMMNSLTVNLHLMLATFYRPTDQRHKILIEEHAFPSDQYAVQSQIQFHGRQLESSLLIARTDERELIDTEYLEKLIDEHADSLAIVVLPGVQYYSGQVFDLQRITRKCHQHGIIAGFDLAHSAGNLPLHLHDWDVDFAVWCSYKFLNSGPGSVGGCFIHQRHCSNPNLRRLAGWWGNNKEDRFLMKDEFQAIPTAEGWQVSNPPILSLAAIRASLEVFERAGGMEPLRQKSLLLTDYFAQLLQLRLGDRINIITPSQPEQRGCQLSIEIRTQDGKEIHQQLQRAGVITDWREPNVIRAAPVPLYNTFMDVFQFVSRLEGCLQAAV